MKSTARSSLEVSRRDVLRSAVTGAVVLGTGLAVVPGTALAMNKAELIEQMASEAGISGADATRTLDAFINATTKALESRDEVCLTGFGSFSISKRSARTGRSGMDRSPVEFEACPAFASSLDLVPGAGDERRNQSCPGVRKADLVIDAALLAEQSERDGHRGLSPDVAKRALDAFVNATTKALRNGDDLELDGFGTWSISKRSARTGRNPQTGKEIQIAAKNVVRFKAGAELSKAVN